MKATKFNWICPYCEKKNLQPITFQFDAPKAYEAVWDCEKCSKESTIKFIFEVTKRVINRKD